MLEKKGRKKGRIPLAMVDPFSVIDSQIMPYNRGTKNHAMSNNDKKCQKK